MSVYARKIIEKAIRGVCEYKQWTLHAINVRTNHVHVVLTAPENKPEIIMNSLKSWSTRRLREAKIYDKKISPWSRHGSTVWLFSEKELAEKIEYVNDCQDKM